MISGQSTKSGQRPKAVDGHRYFIQCNGSPPCYDICTLDVFVSPPSPLQSLFLAPSWSSSFPKKIQIPRWKAKILIVILWCESVYFSCHDHQLLVWTKKALFLICLFFDDLLGFWGRRTLYKGDCMESHLKLVANRINAISRKMDLMKQIFFIFFQIFGIFHICTKN